MRMAVGLPAENATVQHLVELDWIVRESQPRNLTLTEAGVPGRIRPRKEKKVAFMRRENATILHSVERERTVREILHGHL